MSPPVGAAAVSFGGVMVVVAAGGLVVVVPELGGDGVAAGPAGPFGSGPPEGAVVVCDIAG